MKGAVVGEPPPLPLLLLLLPGKNDDRGVSPPSIGAPALETLEDLPLLLLLLLPSPPALAVEGEVVPLKSIK